MARFLFKGLLYEQESELTVFRVEKHHVGRFQVPISDKRKQNGIEKKFRTFFGEKIYQKVSKKHYSNRSATTICVIQKLFQYQKKN